MVFMSILQRLTRTSDSTTSRQDVRATRQALDKLIVILDKLTDFIILLTLLSVSTALYHSSYIIVNSGELGWYIKFILIPTVLACVIKYVYNYRRRVSRSELVDEDNTIAQRIPPPQELHWSAVCALWLIQHGYI